MMVVSLKTGTSEDGSSLVRVVLSGGLQFSLNPVYLSHVCGDILEWETGREISGAEEEEIRFAAACFKTERIAARLIQRAEQTMRGLSYKLKNRGCEGGSIRAVLDRYADLDLVNDERYGILWLRARLARNAGKVAGPRGLLSSLLGRGLDRNDAMEALNKVLDMDTEYALLRRRAERNPPGDLYRLKADLRFQGFSQAVINRYWEEMDDE
jgi:SOS response regulatory protein OraA/RecX